MTIVLTCGTIGGVDPIAERIKWILQDKNISARQLSKDAGLTPVHVGKLLARGAARAGTETIAKIAAAAGVSSDWLLEGKGQPYAPASASESQTPINANLPGWSEAERAARARGTVPAWAIEEARRRSGLVPHEGVTASYVLDEAMQVLRYANHAEVIAKTAADLDKEADKLRKRAEKKLALVREAQTKKTDPK